MKVVINRCFGGFGLSQKAVETYLNLKGIKFTTEVGKFEPKVFRLENGEIFDYYELDRTDPTLVRVVEDLGGDADCEFSELKVVEIPDEVNFEIFNYDGCEAIHEVHRIWA